MVSVLFLFLAISISFLVGSAVLLDDLFYFVQQEVVSISVKVFLSFLVTPKSRTTLISESSNTLIKF